MTLVLFVSIVHVLLCAFMIFVILLQPGKDAGMGAALGGGAATSAFGGRGAVTFLGKVTAVCAMAFFLTSLGLSMKEVNPELFDASAGTQTVAGAAAGADAGVAPSEPAPGAQTPAAPPSDTPGAAAAEEGQKSEGETIHLIAPQPAPTDPAEQAPSTPPAPTP